MLQSTNKLPLAGRLKDYREHSSDPRSLHRRCRTVLVRATTLAYSRRGMTTGHSFGMAEIPARFPICRPPRRRISPVALQARPRSANRTRSPAAISQKLEFFKCPTETIGYFAPRMPKVGARRPVANSQKPAIGGPFYEYQGQFLRAPDRLAGDAVLIAPVSTQIPC